MSALPHRPRSTVGRVAGPAKVAFVLGGGGILGATQVGMLQALAAEGVRPDLVVGASVGAVNGAMLAADPSADSLERLTELWNSLSRSEVFAGGLIGRARTLARNGTHLHSAAPLRRLLTANLPATFAELQVPFQCVAAGIESASAHWFDSGPLVEAVLASSAVPGLLPPVHIGDRHYLDGGLVHSIPVGRAVELGASTIYVLQVGRVEQPLKPPRWPWQVGLVAFEIARRHRYLEEMAAVPDGTRVVVLSSGMPDTPLVSLRYRDTGRVATRIERAYAASREVLADAG
jgi:NTE family protein